jgi:F0F1-type ATP synthase gamma subunit
MAARPYTQELRQMIGELALRADEDDHPLLANARPAIA